MFDWTVLNLQQERSRAPPERNLLSNQQGADGKLASENQDRTRDSFNQDGNRDSDQRKPAPGGNGNGAAGDEKERSRSGGNDYGQKDASQRSGSRGYGGRGGDASGNRESANDAKN